MIPSMACPRKTGQARTEGEREKKKKKECRNCVVGLQESKKNETAHFPNGGDPQSHLAKWVGLESQRGRGNKKVRQPARNLIEWLGFVAPVWMDTQS